MSGAPIPRAVELLATLSIQKKGKNPDRFKKRDYKHRRRCHRIPIERPGEQSFRRTLHPLRTGSPVECKIPGRVRSHTFKAAGSLTPIEKNGADTDPFANGRSSVS